MKSQYPVKVPVIGKVYWVLVDNEKPWQGKLISWHEDLHVMENILDKSIVTVTRNDMFFQPLHVELYLKELRMIEMEWCQVDITEAIEFMGGKTLAEQPASLDVYKHASFDGKYTFALFEDGCIVVVVSSCDGPISTVTPDCDVNPPKFYIGSPV